MTEFRKMRRAKQELGRDDCLEMIERGTSGVLSLIGDGGYPYGVPISYVFVPNDGNGPDRFYFHSAKVGHKIDAVKSAMSDNDDMDTTDGAKASFTIIDRDDIVSDEFTTYFRSVISFGKVHLLEDDDEKRGTVELLARRYSPDESDESISSAIEREFPPLAMIEFDVEHMTGKEAIELVRKREKYGI